MDKSLLDLYADYLISSFGPTTAPGLSRLLSSGLSHDKITRFLSGQPMTSAHLWGIVKPLVRQVQSEGGVLIIDDSLIAKPYTDENDLIAWHYDHTQGRSVKGINFITALYGAPQPDGEEVALPVAFALVQKTEAYEDKKTGKAKRRDPISKNAHVQAMLRACVQNQLLFRYVLSDVWFASAENMTLIKADLKKDFVMPLKTNRKVTLSERDKEQSRYQAVSLARLLRIEALALEQDAPQQIWLEQVSFPLLLVKQVFTNKDGSQGVLYLVTSDLTLDSGRITGLYQRRWQVEVYHKSLKQNASLACSPTRTVRTQSNHFFCALTAFVKLEGLKIRTKTSHFALKSRLYMSALQSAFEQLQALQPANLLGATSA